MRIAGEQAEIDRRTILSTLLAAAPLMWSGTSQAGTKVSQPAVHYQASPKDGQECDTCAHFAAPHSCKLVDGDISPKGWCRLWAKKAA
jgi:predicted transglutaminase-like cysteine proteinase